VTQDKVAAQAGSHGDEEHVPNEKATGVTGEPASWASARPTTSPPRISRTEKTSPGFFHWSENSPAGMLESKWRRSSWKLSGGMGAGFYQTVMEERKSITNGCSIIVPLGFFGKRAEDGREGRIGS